MHSMMVPSWDERAVCPPSSVPLCAPPPLQDSDVVHTEDRVDPVADMEIIHHELRLKDIERMTGILTMLQKVSSAP